MTPEAVAALVEELRPRTGRLPRARLIESLGALHAAWAAPRSELRSEAVDRLRPVTGYARATLDGGLQRLFRSMDARWLLSWVEWESELPEDADGPPVVAVIAAGNLPGTALPSVVQALLLRSGCIAKSATAEPELIPLYLASLQAHDPELAAALRVVCWSREEEPLTAALASGADAVIAYGSDAALEALRAHTRPEAIFIDFGHRLAFSVIAREALTAVEAPALARKLALDIATYDQQGCYSPQAVYVEDGGEVVPQEFAALLAGCLERLRTLLPRRPLSSEEAASIHQFRASIEMRSFADTGVRLWLSAGGTAWTVALDPDPTLRPCALNRTAVLHPVADLSGLPEWVTQAQGSLGALGVAASEERWDQLHESLIPLGVSMSYALGLAQKPPPGAAHDGVNALLVLTGQYEML